MPLEALEDTLETACLIGLLCKNRVSSGVLSFWAVMVTGGGKVDASLDMREIDSGESPVEDASLLTVGGSWHGSPSITSDRQLFVDTIGMRLAGSTL
jgi:hypothetical protein